MKLTLLSKIFIATSVVLPGASFLLSGNRLNAPFSTLCLFLLYYLFFVLCVIFSLQLASKVHPVRLKFPAIVSRYINLKSIKSIKKSILVCLFLAFISCYYIYIFTSFEHFDRLLQFDYSYLYRQHILAARALELSTVELRIKSAFANFGFYGLLTSSYVMLLYKTLMGNISFKSRKIYEAMFYFLLFSITLFLLSSEGKRGFYFITLMFLAYLSVYVGSYFGFSSFSTAGLIFYRALTIYMPILLITFMLLLITFGRLPKNISQWQLRYDLLPISFPASSSSTNCLLGCNNPAFVGLFAYATGHVSYSLEVFDDMLEEQRYFPVDPFGYKTFWLFNRAICNSKLPFISSDACKSSDNWDNYRKSKGRLSQIFTFEWRGILTDYIFDWGILVAPIAASLSFFSFGFLYKCLQVSSGINSQFMRFLLMSAVFLSYAQPLFTYTPLLLLFFYLL